MKTKVEPVPCPRCGCHLTRYFECGCGECKDDYCVNCGRWRSLGRSEFVELDRELDAACTMGTVPHEHPSEEKAARVEKYLARLRNSSLN